MSGAKYDQSERRITQECERNVRVRFRAYPLFTRHSWNTQPQLRIKPWVSPLTLRRFCSRR